MMDCIVCGGEVSTEMLAPSAGPPMKIGVCTICGHAIRLEGRVLAGNYVRQREGHSAGLWVIGLYFLLVYILLPTQLIVSEGDSTFERLPLVLGIVMLALAIVTGRLPRGIGVPAAVFAVLAVATILSGMRGPAGVLEAVRLFFAHTGMGIAMVLLIRKRSDMRLVLNVILLAALLNAFYGLCWVVPGLSIIAELAATVGMPEGVAPGFETRLVGLLSDPTNCGLLLVMGLIISTHRVYKGESKHNLVAAGVLAFALFSTFSRTSWAAAIGGQLLLALRQRRTATRILPLVLGLALVADLGTDVIRRVLDTNEFRMHLSESDTRSEAWIAWLRLAMEEPMGYGLGSTPRLARENLEIDSKYYGQYPHNMYLSLWVESGLPAAISIIVLLVIAFRRAWVAAKVACDPARGFDSAVLFPALLLSISIGVFGLSYMFQLVYIAIGLCLASSAIASQVGHQDGRIPVVGE